MFQQYGSLIFIVIIFLVMYFLMIRPQKKRQQKHQETINQLKKGDAVVTIGRLHGIVDSINQEQKTVTLDCDGIYLEFDLNAVATVNAAQASTTPAAQKSAAASSSAQSATAAGSSEADAKSADHE